MTWQKACRVDEVVDGQGREFLVNGQVIAVFIQAGQLRVTDGMCAHQGGPIAQGELDGNCVTCPWHGWQYDISNGNNLLTGKKMLDCFPVEVRDDEIWVDVG